MTAYAFFQSYLALFVVIALYAIGYAIRRQAWLRLDQIDVDSGRREMDKEVLEKLVADRKAMGPFKKFMDILF